MRFRSAFSRAFCNTHFASLSEETRAKLVAAKTPEEILEIAKSEGIKLSEEELEMVSGGNYWSENYTLTCDFC